MKVVHSFHRFFPEPCGGIQIHLSELMPKLELQGITSKVVAGTSQKQAQSYEHEGIDVYRYPVFPMPPSEPNHGAYRYDSFRFFESWLRTECPDVYHQHQ